MSAKKDRELLKAVGANPRNYVTDSLTVIGRVLDWTEKCGNKGQCLHARSALASCEALEVYFDGGKS